VARGPGERDHAAGAGAGGHGRSVGDASGRPVAAVNDASALGLPPAKTCGRRRRLTLKLKAPDRSMLASVTVAVNGRTKLRARGAKARKPLTLRACARSAPSR
jgi:hypothetical protein